MTWPSFTRVISTEPLSGAASAYGTAFWWSVALALLALIPCLVLMRAESNARKAAAAAGLEDPDRIALDSGAAAEAVT